MQCSAGKTDRYISFEGIECDEQARRILLFIRDCLGETRRPSHWQTYFSDKLMERERRGHDELHFVGSQLNNIRELFEHYGREEALELLDLIEDECC